MTSDTVQTGQHVTTLEFMNGCKETTELANNSGHTNHITCKPASPLNKQSDLVPLLPLIIKLDSELQKLLTYPVMASFIVLLLAIVFFR